MVYIQKYKNSSAIKKFNHKTKPFALFLSLNLAIIGQCNSANAGTTYDSILSNSNWYVPQPNLLAYGSSNSNFISPPPVPIGDQTLWTIGTALNGEFSGSSSATFVNGNQTLISTNIMNGIVEDSGQIRIYFTPTSGGETTLGIGQMRTIDNQNLMEMQMISGISLLVSHWAYMAPYDPNTFTPPSASSFTISPTSPEWAWTAGKPWRMVSPNNFGTNAAGTFLITNYSGGYFWGQGIAPTVSNVGSFTALGSITPEGNVLFNTLSGETAELTSFSGQITGDESNAEIVLHYYDSDGSIGDITILSLIQPYNQTVNSLNNPAATGAASSLYKLTSTTTGLESGMAPVINSLNNMSNSSLSTAVSQTLPLLTGAASQATANAQRSLYKIVQARQKSLSGLSTGEQIVTNNNLWGTVLGNWAKQNDLNNVSGYRINTGRIVLGVDNKLSSEFNIGLLFALGNSSVDSNNADAPSNLIVNSFQIGNYGDYDIHKDLNWSYQADIGINKNKGSRSISFYGVSANSKYYSYTSHLGSGLKKVIKLKEDTYLTPSMQINYLHVHSEAYTENYANVLNLNVNSQNYEELFTSIDLRIDHNLTSYINIFSNVGAGYNCLNSQVQITSSYTGGGDAFMTNGLKTSPWIYNTGLGFSSFLKKGLEFVVRYDLEKSTSGYLNQTASAKMKIPF